MTETKGDLGYKHATLLWMRVFQLVCLGFMLSGFVWASSDWLLIYVLVSSPVTPLSVLFMAYGSFGILLSELSVRLLSKRWNGEKKD